MNWRVLVATGVVLSITGTTSAQPQLGPPPRPAFSPYLNLTRPGGSTALNYYGLVRPEIQARQSINNLQGTVANNQQAIGDIQNGLNDLPGTGHPTAFMNYRGYFLTQGQGQTGGFGAGAGTQSFSSPFNRVPTPGGTGGGGRAPTPRR